jgi:uncharacterized repeat protein (TIGR04138 family)
VKDKPKSMEEVILTDGRYPPDAYNFLHDGLSRAVRQVHGIEMGQGEQKHVTGQEICFALRELAAERWGMLAETVLAKWNISRTDDFGNMVYLLIENGLMRKTDADSIDDFHAVYDFVRAFGGQN